MSQQNKTLQWNPSRATKLNIPGNLNNYEVEKSLREKFATILKPDFDVCEAVRIATDSQIQLDREIEEV